MYQLDVQKIEDLRIKKYLKKNKLAAAVGYSSFSGYTRFEETGRVKNRFRVLAFCKMLDIDDPAEILLYPKTLFPPRDPVLEYLMSR